IRDFHVTGVQTCALPISTAASAWRAILPVSRTSVSPPHCSSLRAILNIPIPLPATTARWRRPRDAPRGTRTPLHLFHGGPPRVGGRAHSDRDACSLAAPVGRGGASRPAPYAKRARGRPRGAPLSAPDAQPLDQRAVARLVAHLDIVQQLAALADHLQQAPPRVIVLLVALEVLGQVRDALGEDRDLHLGRAGIALLRRVVPDELFLASGRDRHRASFHPSGFTRSP